MPSSSTYLLPFILTLCPLKAIFPTYMYIKSCLLLAFAFNFSHSQANAFYPLICTTPSFLYHFLSLCTPSSPRALHAFIPQYSLCLSQTHLSCISPIPSLPLFSVNLLTFSPLPPIPFADNIFPVSLILSPPAQSLFTSLSSPPYLLHLSFCISSPHLSLFFPPALLFSLIINQYSRAGFDRDE